MRMKKFFEQRSFILIVATVAFVSLATVLIVTLAGNAIEKKREYDAMFEQLQAQNEENARLEEELKYGISDEEKEYIARNELGYILPGERVYADAS